MFAYILDLIYPNLCLSCGKDLPKDIEHICLSCRLSLPISDSIDVKGNSFEKLFLGRVEVLAACYFLVFEKNNITQSLIHNLKYKGQKELGVTLGKLCALYWQNKSFFKNIDVVVPIPIHKKKKEIRGYNQSEYLAKGISEVLGLQLDSNSLIKEVHTSSQTRKKRWERWQNVESTFRVSDGTSFTNKNILLVDDVVTTGATLEASVQALQKAEASTVKIITLAASL
jgi:ComF family protein